VGNENQRQPSDDGVNADGIATLANPATQENPLPDTDEDGVANYRDLDSDNDGLNDVEEANGVDANHDGILDANGTLLDPATLPDEDEDGTFDPFEPNNPDLPALLDEDGDGVIDEMTDT